MDLSQMTGAAGTLTIGGRTLLLRKLTFRDRAQIREYLEQHTPRPMAKLAEALKELAPLKETDPETYEFLRGRLADLTYQDHKAGALLRPESEAVLNTPEGMAFLLWLRAREEQRDLTSPEVMQALMEKETPEDLVRKLNEFSAREAEAEARAAEERTAANPPQPAPGK